MNLSLSFMIYFSFWLALKKPSLKMTTAPRHHHHLIDTHHKNAMLQRHLHSGAFTLSLTLSSNNHHFFMIEPNQWYFWIKKVHIIINNKRLFILIEAATRNVLCKKVILVIWQNSQENTCARVSFLIKLQALVSNFIKKSFWHRCFPINFVKFLRTSF